MRKTIYLTVILLGIVVIFVMCSKEEATLDIQANTEVENIVDESNYSQEFADLNNELQIYTQEFMSKQPTQLRGFANFIIVTAADILGGGAGVTAGGKIGALFGTQGATAGAIVGGIFCAASASILAYRALPQSYSVSLGKPNSLINSEVGYIPTGTNISAADSMGYYHNKIIEDIFNQYPNIYKESQDFIFQCVIDKMRFYGFNISANQETALKTESAAINQIIASNDNWYVKFRERYPESIASINVIETYVNNLSQLSTNEQALNYTTGIREIVTTSSIPTSSATLIKGSLAVGVNSKALWIAK